MHVNESESLTNELGDLQAILYDLCCKANENVPHQMHVIIILGFKQHMYSCMTRLPRIL